MTCDETPRSEDVLLGRRLTLAMFGYALAFWNTIHMVHACCVDQVMPMKVSRRRVHMCLPGRILG